MEMETEMKPKRLLSVRRVVVLSVVVALAAAAFATLALVSTNLAQAQEGETPLQPATPIPPAVEGSFAWGGAPAPSGARYGRRPGHHHRRASRANPGQVARSNV